MKLVIRSVYVLGHPNLRTWQPEDPGSIADVIYIDIGEKSKKSSDSFSIRVATPTGLLKLQGKDGIIATRPLLVMQRYDFADLWRWLEQAVAKCEKESWAACVESLRYYFGWEYDNYKEM